MSNTLSQALELAQTTLEMADQIESDLRALGFPQNPLAAVALVEVAARVLLASKLSPAEREQFPRFVREQLATRLGVTYFAHCRTCTCAGAPDHEPSGGMS